MSYKIAGISLLGLLLLLLPVVDSPAQENFRVAFVDMELVYDNHPIRQSAVQYLEEKRDELQAELEERAEGETDEEKRELAEEYNRRFIHIRDQVVDEFHEDIMDQLQLIISNVAQQLDIHLVLKQEDVVYGGIDITPAVMEYLEKVGEVLEEEHSELWED